jgi:hypothetical protein
MNINDSIKSKAGITADKTQLEKPTLPNLRKPLQVQPRQSLRVRALRYHHYQHR